MRGRVRAGEEEQRRMGWRGRKEATDDKDVNHVMVCHGYADHFVLVLAR